MDKPEWRMILNGDQERRYGDWNWISARLNLYKMENKQKKIIEDWTEMKTRKTVGGT